MEKKWIINKYNYEEFNNSRIKSILFFGLIWSIFEKEVCNNNAKIFDSRTLSLNLMAQLDTQSKRRISLIWNHFLKRYIDQDTHNINNIFENFTFNPNDDKNFVEYALRKQKNASYEEKCEAIIRVIFRLRNNLLHGQKDVTRLYEQNDNFKNSNKFLTILIDKRIRLN